MKKFGIALLGATAVLLTIPEVQARPPHHKGRHHDKNDGLALAAGIVHLVKEVVAPTPVVVAPPPTPVVVAPPPAPVVVAPPAPVVVVPPRRYHHPAPPPRHHRPAPPPRQHRPHGGPHGGHRR